MIRSPKIRLIKSLRQIKRLIKKVFFQKMKEMMIIHGKIKQWQNGQPKIHHKLD